MNEFNICDTVKVKLTDMSLKIYEQYLEKLFYSMPPKLQKIFGKDRAEGIQLDEDGYLDISLSDVMKIFGKYMVHSATEEELPFSTVIKIPKSSLKECEEDKNKSR